MTATGSRDDGLAGALASTAEHMVQMHAEGIPAVMRPSAPLYRLDEVFDWIAIAHPPRAENSARQKIQALARASAGMEGPAPREIDPGRPAELYRDGGLLLDATPYLPRRDETFDAWLVRVRDALGPGFGLQAPGIECASWDAMHRLQALLSPVLKGTGPRTYRYNVFFGDYPRTPFGFHLDPHQEGVFQYVVHGSRRALFWDGRSMSDEDAQWIEDSNGLSTPPRPPDLAFDLTPGDLVYWPGDYVHGMEPDGPSMGVSMVIDRASPRRHDQVVSTLEAMTCGGRAALPPMAEAAMLDPGARLVRRAAFPAAYERVDDVLVIGVCGRTFNWPDPGSTRAAMRLVDALNAQSVIAVDDVVARCADATLPPDMAYEAIALFEELGFFGRASD